MKTKKIQFFSIAVTAMTIAGICTFAGGCSFLPFEKVSSTDYAMGTVINQTIYIDNGSDICDAVMSEITHLEKDVISIMYDDSEISRINSAKETLSGCSDEFTEYMNAANDLAAQSNHAFDPAIGKLIKLWAVDSDNPHKPDKSDIESVLKDKEQMLNFGAIGKGIACDKIKNILSGTEYSPHVKGAVIAVGGSVLVYGTKPDNTPWEIAVSNPRKETGEDYLGVLSFNQKNGLSKYVSTSGDYEKYFEEDGIRYHHILDPSTGYPAQSGLISVTIVCDNGLLSDGLSTACFVLGIEKSLSLLKHYNAEAIFVDQNKHVTVTDGISDNFKLIDKKYVLSE